LALALGGCAAQKPQISADLTFALDAAIAAEVAYAADPAEDPATVSDLTRLLASAQVAVAAWQSTTKPEDQAIASAAISALVSYEVSAGIAP
jgi:hypothetical protein